MRCMAFTYAVEISCLWAIRVDVQVQIQMVGEMMVGDMYIPRGVHVNVSDSGLNFLFLRSIRAQCHPSPSRLKNHPLANSSSPGQPVPLSSI